MDRVKQRQMVFDNSNSWQLLIKMSVPSVVTTMVMMVYNLADVFFIGQTGDSLQVAAVSLCTPFFSLMSGLGMLFGHGGCIRCATLLGEKRYEDVRSVSALCFWAPVFAGGLMTVVMALCKPWALSVLGASSQTAGYAGGYLGIMIAGLPITMFCQAVSSLLRSDGMVRQPMYGNIMGSLINILLDPIFILVLGWGVRGAAIATVIANAANAFYLIMLVRRKRDVFSMDPREIRFTWDLTAGTLALGVPMMLSTLMSSFSGVINNHFLSGYGDLYLAANGVSSKLRMIVTMLVMGVCIGIQPAISYYHGAKERAKLKNLLCSTAVTTTVIGVILSILFYVFRDKVIALFIEDDEVIRYGRQMILGCMISGPVQGIYQLCTSYLQGTGSVALSSVLAVSRQALHIPILIVANAVFGFMGLVFSPSVSTYLCVCIGLGLCAWRSCQLEYGR